VLTVNQWVEELTKAQSRALPEAEKVLSKGALNIKQGAARRISGLAHAPAYPRSIGYDLYHLPGSARARIGPDKQARQGALGNVLEYGTVNNPPHPHLAPELDAEGPRFMRALGQLGADLLAGKK